MSYRKPIEEPDTFFGQWLSDVMFDSDYNELEVANVIGKSRETVSRHLSGKSRPTLNTVKKYAELFGYDWMYVYELTLKDNGGLLDPYDTYNFDDDEENEEYI